MFSLLQFVSSFRCFIPKISFLKFPQTNLEIKSTNLPDLDGNSASELPLDFLNAVRKSAISTAVSYRQAGINFCRIDFDTTIGDLTYTSLKNTMPFLKQYLIDLCNELQLIPTLIETSTNTSEQTINEELPKQQSIRVFFPDMGAAVLARNDWKLMDLDASQVPPCISTANIQNDGLKETDVVAIIVCPQYSEADCIQRILDLTIENNILCIMINPNIINRDQGFGVRKFTIQYIISSLIVFCSLLLLIIIYSYVILGAKNLRKNILAKFQTAYLLKTLKSGALVREWPGPFTLWKEDSQATDGYILIQNYNQEPDSTEISEILGEFDEDDNDDNPNKNIVNNLIGEIGGFFKGLSRL
jgi:hypothetical protein